MQPIDYGVQIADPTQAFLGAFNTGAAIQQTGIKQQQQEQLLQQQQTIQAGLAKLRSPDASIADVANLAMILPPEQSKSLRESFALRTDEKNKNTLNAAGQVVSALFAGENDIAANFIDQQATAKKNSGDVEGSKFLSTWRDITNINPGATQDYFTAQLLSMPGGDKIVENIIKLQAERRTQKLEPSALKKAVADADAAVAEATTKQQTAKNAPEKAAADAAKATADAEKAKVDATYADQVAQLGLKKTQADIDIAKQNANIAALNANISRETNIIKRDELILKRDERNDKLDQAKKDQKALLDSQVSGIDNFLNTAIRAANTPKNIREGASGPIASRFIPTTSQDTADYEALIETLGAQAFLAQIPQIKNTGSLSEKEGDKLQASLQNLSLKQSDARLQENLKEATRLLTKARENIITRSGTTTAPPDTPAATQVEVVTPSGTYKFANKAAADAFKQRAGIK